MDYMSFYRPALIKRTSSKTIPQMSNSSVEELMTGKPSKTKTPANKAILQNLLEDKNEKLPKGELFEEIDEVIPKLKSKIEKEVKTTGKKDVEKNTKKPKDSGKKQPPKADEEEDTEVEVEIDAKKGKEDHHRYVADAPAPSGATTSTASASATAVATPN